MSQDTSTAVVPRLKQIYRNDISSQLMKDLGLDNINQVPEIEKVVINVGVGKNKDDKKALELVKTTLRKITGQQPVEVIAKKSIAGFKIRQGMNVIGIKVTLRGNMMYEFIDRLTNIVLPRVRDFHGVSDKAFDKQGNYSLGIVEQSVFPELSFEDIAKLHGMQVNFTINNGDPAKSKALLESFGIPFVKRKESA